MSRFLLVSLNIKAILQETTLHRRREKLGTMTNGLGLGGAYDAAIGRIKAQEGDGARLGMEALMWISHSERSLTVDEICHALAVEIGSADINFSNMPSIRTVLSCCQGLAAVDEGSSTIRLIHFTLKEYLSRHTDLFDTPHSKIAETCLTYLNFQAIKDLSASLSRGLRGSSLLGYSSLYWGTHMRMELSDRSRCLALELLNQYDNHVSAELLWGSVNGQSFTGYTRSIEPFSALHCISYFGIAEVAINLIRTKRWDVNQRDSAGLTPLMWAARYGRALSWAADSGHEGVVRLFLGPLLVNPGNRGRMWGKTQQVLSVLFGRKYVNPDSRGKGGQTPLSLAARNGYDGVVRLLLEREGVSPNSRDNDGQTLLSSVAQKGRDGLVKLLLEREDVLPDSPDNRGLTPLSWAARNGHDEAVRLLLEREDVNPNTRDNNGQTPLLLATRNGRDGVVKLLLEPEDANPDTPDNRGRTPLSWAAEDGRARIAELLLEREDLSPDRPDNSGKTPLSQAAWFGRYGVVKLLLGREDVSPDRPDNDGKTPLSWAAWYGHDGVMVLLLGWEDVCLDRLDNDGRTLLSWAARNGHGGIVELLLGREDVSPDKPDNHGRTPLSWAAEDGRAKIVELLMGREDVNSDRPDNSGKTPLSWAALHEHEGVVKLLKARNVTTPSMV